MLRRIDTIYKKRESDAQDPGTNFSQKFNAKRGGRDFADKDNILLKGVHLVWENTQDGLCMISSRGHIALVNRAWCRIFGVNEVNIIGTPFDSTGIQISLHLNMIVLAADSMQKKRNSLFSYSRIKSNNKISRCDMFLM